MKLVHFLTFGITLIVLSSGCAGRRERELIAAIEAVNRDTSSVNTAGVKLDEFWGIPFHATFQQAYQIARTKAPDATIDTTFFPKQRARSIFIENVVFAGRTATSDISLVLYNNKFAYGTVHFLLDNLFNHHFPVKKGIAESFALFHSLENELIQIYKDPTKTRRDVGEYPVDSQRRGILAKELLTYSAWRFGPRDRVIRLSVEAGLHVMLIYYETGLRDSVMLEEEALFPLPPPSKDL